MTTAFVLGNGNSRKPLDLNQLREHGPIYGCNALYREFIPDCLISTDKPIADEIQNSGYAKNNRFHTRRPLPGWGARSLPKEYKGFSSGPNAVAQACIDGYDRIYLIGFDLGTADGRFNNIYADTKFYKKLDDPPTFAGNWMKQIRQIAEQYTNKQFIRVTGPESAHAPTLVDIPNLKHQSINQLQESLNSRKGML